MGQADIAIRRLAELLQAQLVEALLAPEPVRIMKTEKSELKIVERLTDQVVRAEIGGVETIVNVEFQASHEASFPARLLAYHALLRLKHFPLPVRSVVVYLMHRPPPAGDVPGVCIGAPGTGRSTSCTTRFAPGSTRSRCRTCDAGPASHRSRR